MSIPFLKTKLYTPPLRREIVARPRLIERLNAGAHTKLTLISAPAGFGKTTLISAWAADAPAPVAWLSLDEEDNDPVRFLAYLVAALQQAEASIGQGIAEALCSTRRPRIEPLLSVLINQLDALSFSIILVLDDYQFITTPLIHTAMTFLLDHLPATVHVAIATRLDPPLPLARLRGRGQLAELRQADLSFTPDETAAFLEQFSGLDFSTQQITALRERTEGWVTGIHLAALSMQGREDASAFVSAFTGSHRYVLDYLTEEVLDRQTENLRAFLLETSVLDRLSGPLCDAVTHRDDGQERLEQLESAALFIVPLDGERRWYRYHHLFADLLRNRLERSRAEAAPILHGRASRWYEAHGMASEAVRHALAADDSERTADLVEENAFTAMDRGELTTVLGWLDALPDELVRSRPWLSVACAWALMYAGRMSDAEQWLKAAEDAAPGTERLRGTVAAVRTYVTASRGDVPSAIVFARQALAQLPQGDAMARAVTAGILSSLYRFRGDFTASSQAATEAISISRATGDTHLATLASCNLAGTLILQGRLRQAAATLRDVLQITDDDVEPEFAPLPFTGLAFTALASVLREWNDLAAAERFARRGIALSEQWGQAEVTIQGYIELARTLQSREDEEGARDAIKRAMQTAQDLSAWTLTPLESVAARLHLAQGDLTTAYRWAEENALSLAVDPDFQQMENYLVLARVLIAQERSSDALDLLAQLLEKAGSAGAVGYEIEILTLQATALQAQDRRDSALKRLQQALTLSEPEGYIRTFADEGAPMTALLRQAAAQGVAPAYAGQILAAIGSSRPVTTLIEPLSDREMEVLRLIAAGLSNQQIADELLLAVGTVKKHTHNIYGKLDVRSRTQAVGRAQDLDLL
jgi:LuxR family maltose regulon positive regulatory protein